MKDNSKRAMDRAYVLMVYTFIGVIVFTLQACAGFSARIVRTLNCDAVHATVKVQGFGPTVQLDEEDRLYICAPVGAPHGVGLPTPSPAASAASGPVSVNLGVQK